METPIIHLIPCMLTTKHLFRAGLIGLCLTISSGCAELSTFSEVFQSQSEVVENLTTKAEAGDATAQFRLGLMYANGEGMHQNDQVAVKWYRKAAEQGLAKAQNNLGRMYAYGQGIPKDDREAVAWYRKAADQGNARAQTSLGWMYVKGRGVPQNDQEAAKWYRKAADQGFAQAQHNLGNIYAKGQGVPQNIREAMKWYRKAANQGHAQAQTNLSWMRKHQDDREAVERLRIAADKNQQRLQRKADKTQPESVDNVKALAEAGDAVAQFNLGVSYYHGLGVEQDDLKAAIWYRKAAEQGHAQAQLNLGEMYANGRGVPQDDLAAGSWYRKAAEQGIPRAQSNLGWMYAKGQGVPQDDQEAEKWYRKAADQGFVKAQRTLENMYAHGRGGHQYAREVNKRLNERMDDYSKYNDEPRKDQKTISQPSKPKKLSKASGFVLLSSGPVKSVKDKEIIIESKDSTSSYVITKSTKICVDGFQTDSWRSLKKAQTATVTTELNSNMAIRIDNGPIVVGAGSLELFIPECKSQAIKAKLDSVKEVQKLLTKAGYDVGSADGIAGPRTRSAIRAFQKGHGYPESGTVSNELIIQLKDILTQ